MELKLDKFSKHQNRLNGLNRTFMELKLDEWCREFYLEGRLNRTFMELKHISYEA